MHTHMQVLSSPNKIPLQDCIAQVHHMCATEPCARGTCTEVCARCHRPSGGGTELPHEELTNLINSIMTLTNVAFFGLAGASLKLVSGSQLEPSLCLVFLNFGDVLYTRHHHCP
jgi:hypothetical protein